MTAVITGLGLAAAAGLNAWAVLLLLHGLVRLLPQEFPGPTADLLASGFVFQLALVLFVAEFVVDKIPVVHRLWDVGHTLLRPLAGALVALAASPASNTMGKAGMALAGATVSLAAHVAKTTSRLTTTAATAGFTQFAVSLAEDIVAVLLAIVVFFVPAFAAFLLAGLAVLLATHRHRVWRGLQVLFFRLQHPRRHPPRPTKA